MDGKSQYESSSILSICNKKKQVKRNMPKKGQYGGKCFSPRGGDPGGGGGPGYCTPPYVCNEGGADGDGVCGVQSCYQNLTNFECQKAQNGQVVPGYYCQPDLGKDVPWQCQIPPKYVGDWVCPKDTSLCQVVVE
jgi:hypothetical protein